MLRNLREVRMKFKFVAKGLNRNWYLISVKPSQIYRDLVFKKLLMCECLGEMGEKGEMFNSLTLGWANFITVL